ncbi:MAG: hypothetical protein HC904_17740 [Blastochloris sp.]|nr:hypothetical protein [Blastochloris sp.]
MDELTKQSYSIYMKPRGLSFGNGEINYGLSMIFSNSVIEFRKTDDETKRIETEYKKNQKINLAQSLIQLSEKRNEKGVMLIISAVALLEQKLYNYAISYLNPDSYEEHFERLRLHTKWLLVPRLCQNKIITETDPAITHLKELITARNAVIHPKRQVMYDVVTTNRRLDKEVRRFIAACRGADKTVTDVINLLK